MSGGSKTNTVTQTTGVPEQFAPYAADYLSRAQGLTSQPYQPYPGQLVAPQSPYTTLGTGLIANRALYGGGVEQAASQEAQKTLQGGYLGYSPGANQFLGQTTPVGQNQFIGQTTNVGTNQFAGANPELERQIQAQQGDIVRGFQLGTAAPTAAAASRARALGGSAYNELAALQGGELAKQLGTASSAMRMQDYANQQQLAEAALNRSVAAQQADLARSGQLQQSQLGLQTQAGQTDLARNAALAESGLGRAQQSYADERTNQLRALGLAPTTQQMDYTNLQSLLGAGAIQQGYQQSLLDSAYQQWQQQQQYPYQQIGFGTGLLGTLAGSQSTSTSPYTGPSALQSTLGTGLAGAAAGYSAGPALGAMMGTTITPGVGTILGGLFGAGLGYLGSR